MFVHAMRLPILARQIAVLRVVLEMRAVLHVAPVLWNRAFRRQATISSGRRRSARRGCGIVRIMIRWYPWIVVFIFGRFFSLKLSRALRFLLRTRSLQTNLSWGDKEIGKRKTTTEIASYDKKIKMQELSKRNKWYTSEHSRSCQISQNTVTLQVKKTFL